MKLSENIIKKSFWAMKSSEALDLLETTNEGLAQEDVSSRLKTFGKNEIEKEKRIGKLKIFLNQFRSPLIFLLIVAGLITILVKDYTDASVIFAAAILNSILGFYQENKAEEALTHLKTYIKERIRIIREGKESEIDAREIVPGDIIRISQGDRIPADARLIYVNNFMVDEALLTGESLPTNKVIEPSPFNATIGDQKSMVFSGTLAVQGFANAVVCRTGSNTEIGRIASMVKGKGREKTPLQKSITDFSIKASILLLSATILVFFIGTLAGYSILKMFLTSVAILVAAIPEGLPIAMTVILAIGVQRLAKRNGVIRKLLAVETLGSTNIILTDKTGTLTEAKMKLSKINIFDKSENFDKEFILKFSIVNSDTIVENPDDSIDKWRILGRPLEVALVKAAAKEDILPEDAKKELDEINFLPFNSVNKFSASVFEYKSNYYLALLGAPEILLKLSTKTSERDRRGIAGEIDKMAYGGERVLGIAFKKLGENEKDMTIGPKQKFDGLRFLSTISFNDPIRKGVRDTIHRIEQIGIKTIILTGDHRGTAESVARELGFPTNDKNIINGSELDAMTNEELKEILPNIRVVSRVSPEGKMKIVKAYQDIGNIIAMTGDGINDAPSLKQADIGVAMGSGTDVAQDVADLVLLDNNFQTIVAAIDEGRLIMENIRKVIVYLFSSVFDELVLIGGALLLGLALPLNALQILIVNLISDSFPALSIAFEEGVDNLLVGSQREPGKLLDKEMKFLIFAIGIPTSLLILGVYYSLLILGYEPTTVRTFIYVAFSLYSIILIFSIRSLRKSIFKYNPFSNYYLVGSVLFSILVILITIYVPFFQDLLDVVALSPIWLLGVLIIALINIGAVEFGKWLYRR